MMCVVTVGVMTSVTVEMMSKCGLDTGSQKHGFSKSASGLPGDTAGVMSCTVEGPGRGSS